MTHDENRGKNISGVGTDAYREARGRDNGASRIHVPGQPHRTVAQMSSQQRSALMDETLMTVHELLLQVAHMGEAIMALKREQDALSAAHETLLQAVRTDSQAATAFVSRSFLARLHWLLTGR